MTDKIPNAVRLAAVLDCASSGVSRGGLIVVGLVDVVQTVAELRRLHEANAELVQALKALLKRDESNTCQHDETYRGGAIWEICRQCDAKWADDEGGKPEWQDPPEWTAAREAIAKHEGET